ncbi:MAG: tail fiber domain-containing protein [Bacteroidota bacterium]
MKRKNLLRQLSMFAIALCLTAFSANAQTFPGTLTVTNGEIDISSGNPSIQFSNANIFSGTVGIGSALFSINADVIMNLNAEIGMTLRTTSGAISLLGGTGSFAGGQFSDPNNVVQFGVSGFGSRNNFALLESGSYGIINSTNSKWLGLGSAPPGAGANVFGKRIQWGENFAVFNLRESSATDRDLAIQWGGTTANNQLFFEYANGPFATATRVMQLESNGNVGIGATPGTADRLRVNGRIRFGSVEFIEDGGPFEITAGGDVRPDVDNSRDLGTPTFRWDDVFATNGVIQTSDRRSKKDIKSLSYGLDELMQLRPVTYKWKKDSDKGDQVGLIAQDVQKVMKEIVYDPKEDLEPDEDGNMVAPKNAAELRLGISYSALIPVIIKSIQEQQAVIVDQQSTIDEQNSKITNLLTELEALKSALAEQTFNPGNGAGEETGQLDQARMIQNSPNPFNESTNIAYYLPETVQDAKLYIYNMNGSLVSKHRLDSRGQASYTLKAKSLSPGIYLYSIVADDKELGVKRMIIED